MKSYDKIEAYGVVLHRLTIEKIEMLRTWRNHPKIQQYMEYREEITPEMQFAWFHRIENANNYYFIIEAEGREIGCINVRDIDYEAGVGEPGIFIWDDDFLNSTYSFRAALTLTDFCFYDLKLNHLVIHILKDNARAIKYNLAQGYKMSSGQENIYNQEYTLIPEHYEKKKAKLIKYLL